MVDDRRLTISRSSRLHPDEVSRRTFATARRGFDPHEVRAFLEQVAREMTATEEREHELHELVAAAERRAENPVLDEATLTSALGQETARVLRSAHDAAGELVARAEADANRMLAEAQEEAGKVQARAEQIATDRAAQSEAAGAEIRRRAQEDAAARIDNARAEAEALVEQTRSECRAMLSEAQELRARVLGDLSRRRKVLHSQIEQLRAGRERLAQTIGGVRETVERVTDELFRAEDDARVAAEAAGRHVATQQEAEPAASEVAARIVQSADEIVSVVPEHETANGALVVSGAEDPGDQQGATPADTAAHEGNGTARQQSVEELFARLRAEQDSEPEPELRVEEPEKHARRDDASDSQVASSAGEIAVIEASDQEKDVGELEPAVAEEHRHPMLDRRDEVLNPIAATLARRLKRALTDDQNDILDRLRGAKRWSPELLEAEDLHRARYASAAQEQLVEAARAGATFGGAKADEAPSVDDFVVDLAAAVVTPLRRRLQRDESELDHADDAFWVEHVGAAFRDWKGQRIERLARDEAVAAFSRAALAAADDEALLEWIVDDDGIECPDCDDNSLAGSIPKGEAFPTGHPHPPAHAGCRCLLVVPDA